MAAFSVGGDSQDLTKFYHVRPGTANAGEKEAAIRAFTEIIRPCIERNTDGAIEVLEQSRTGNPQYCLVILAHRAGKTIGAAAFVRRCADSVAAGTLLERIKKDATSFRIGPT
jgi:hypothetical protein